VSIGKASLFRASSSLFHYSSLHALVVTSSTAASMNSFYVATFASVLTSTALLTTTFSTAVASTFDLALSYSIFIFFLVTSSLFFWTFSLFLLFLSTTISSSFINPKCVEVVAMDALVVASPSSIFQDSSQDLSSSKILPIGLPYLLAITSS
jgi:hypothetical protein